jgi:hypothetical protein
MKLTMIAGPLRDKLTKLREEYIRVNDEERARGVNSWDENSKTEKIDRQYRKVQSQIRENYENYLRDNKIPTWAAEELNRYNNNAGKIVDKDIFPYFERFCPTQPIVLYRGLGFKSINGAPFMKKLGIKDPQVGSTGIYKTLKVQSWSSNPEIAEQFAGTFSIVGRDPDSLGVILKTTVTPDQIGIAMSDLPDEILDHIVRFHQKEYLLKGGSYPVEICKLFGEWGGQEGLQIDALIKREMKKLGEKLSQKFGGGTPHKTWNSDPGWSFDLPNKGGNLSLAILDPDHFQCEYNKWNNSDHRPCDTFQFDIKNSSKREFLDLLVTGRIEKIFDELWAGQHEKNPRKKKI